MDNKIKVFMGNIATLEIIERTGAKVKNYKLEVDAIVNAGNNELLPGGGVDGAIHSAAGPELALECEKLGGCKTGEAKITKGYKIPVKYIIHTVGPVWEGGGHNEAEILSSCYQNSLELAVKHGIKTIAFPAISTGAFGYPATKAGRIAMKAVTSFLKSHPEEIKTVFFITDWNNYFLYDASRAELSKEILPLEKGSKSQDAIPKKFHGFVKNNKPDGKYIAIEVWENAHPDKGEIEITEIDNETFGIDDTKLDNMLSYWKGVARGLGFENPMFTIQGDIGKGCEISYGYKDGREKVPPNANSYTIKPLSEEGVVIIRLPGEDKSLIYHSPLNAPTLKEEVSNFNRLLVRFFKGKYIEPTNKSPGWEFRNEVVVDNENLRIEDKKVDEEMVEAIQKFILSNGYATWPKLRLELKVSYATIIRTLNYMVEKKILLCSDKAPMWRFRNEIEMRRVSEQNSKPKFIDPNSITVKFGGKHPPKDEMFIALFKKVIKGEIPYYWALVKKEAIKPLSDHKPKISKELRKTYLEEIHKDKFPSVHIYEEDGKYVMSDDYSLYYLYLELGWSEIPSRIMGEPLPKVTRHLTKLKPPTSTD